MKRYFSLLALAAFSACAFGQQSNPPRSRVQSSNSPQTQTQQQPSPEQPPQETQSKNPEAQQQPAAREPQQEPQRNPMGERREPSALAAGNEHFDMTEAPASVTHHTATIGGKLLHYTATTGRMPIKDAEGKILAEMFYVAYTLDGTNSATRPVAFAFNGGPGSASFWIHMGAVGPKRVQLENGGWMPPPPYKWVDNESSPLDKTDVVVVDAIGTGYSRARDNETGKKFWSVKGDIESFGEFIRMYISRNERWGSPLYLLGESYGTTRSAGIAGYLHQKGVAFNGVMLLSTVLYFQTLEFSKQNDTPYPLILPSLAMVASYHHKLAPDLAQDPVKLRQEVEQFATGEYTQALEKGDSLTPQERQHVIDQLARFTGLEKQVIDDANLRIDVRIFTHYLLHDQHLRVGRLDARYEGPDPNGFNDTPFYDPSSGATGPPFYQVWNNYVRTELNYKVDMPYYMSARDNPAFNWEWGSASNGYADTASALRSAMVQDPWLKVLVLEGYYDLATPYFAADYTFNHMDLPPTYYKNISKATYNSGHMVYLDDASRHKLHDDVDRFIEQTEQRSGPSPVQNY